MRYQSREFHKFFWAINCCSYNTHGFHEIFAFWKFCFVLASFIFAKKCEISRKSLWNAQRKFSHFFAKRFVRWKVNLQSYKLIKTFPSSLNQCEPFIMIKNDFFVGQLYVNSGSFLYFEVLTVCARTTVCVCVHCLMVYTGNKTIHH